MRAPIKMQSGGVLQSGMGLQQRGARKPFGDLRGPYRAIVLNTYMPTDDGNQLKRYVECDVLLVERVIPIRNAVVQQAVYGENEAAPWVPRATKRVISSQVALNFDASDPTTPFPALDDLDGDVVLVDFIEGNIHMPVITGALPHDQSKRKIVLGGGWSESDHGSTRGTAQSREHYLCWRGTELRINETGDLLIDTVGAHNDDAGEDPSTGMGQVRVRIKKGQHFTVECAGTDTLEVYQDALGVHVDVGEGATEHGVLGDVLKTLLTALTVSTPFGPSSTPLNAASFPTFLAKILKVT